MKTAEEILKSKLDGKITFVNNPDYTFNKVIEAMEEYRLQSHPSPMSAEQRTNAMDVLKKHLKVDWIFSGDSGKAIIDAMEEWKRTPTITDGEQKYIDATKNKLCAICGYFCNNVHHANNWYDITPQSVTAMSAEQVEELDKYRKNAEDNYLTTPISVLRYITKMENLFATTPSVKPDVDLPILLAKFSDYFASVQIKYSGNNFKGNIEIAREFLSQQQPYVKPDGWVSVEECKKREQDAYNDGYNTGLSHGKPIGY